MQMPSPSLIVVIGTGGTISARAASETENVRYTAGEIDAGELTAGLATPPGRRLEAVQLARIDSKDMDFATWRSLARAVSAQLERPEVAAVVITHGTDTLEETAWFLQRVLAPRKPVVLTAAMRPASSREADGPRNLADALVVAASAGATGVVAVLAGTVHTARDVRKSHPYRLDAFSSGEAGPLGTVESGSLRLLRDWPAPGDAAGLGRIDAEPAGWPFIAIVTSTAGADARSVAALVDAGCAGIVVAATGNGTVHRELESALAAAMTRGVEVLRSTRCLDGRIVTGEGGAAPGELPSAGDLTPQKARVELLLNLLAGPTEAA